MNQESLDPDHWKKEGGSRATRIRKKGKKRKRGGMTTQGKKTRAATSGFSKGRRRIAWKSFKEREKMGPTFSES